MTIGSNIRIKRLIKGYNQFNMAHMLNNVSENTYRKIEGDKVVHKDERLETIAKILDTTVDELKKGIVVVNDNTTNGTNSNILPMNGTVNYYKTPDEIQEENHQLIIERLTTINALNEKRIDELSKTVHNLEEIINLLKKGGSNHE
jgi:transcriptional regulator with XRE-family HTH domain